MDGVLTSKARGGDGPLKVGDLTVWVYILSPQHTRERRQEAEAEIEALDQIANQGIPTEPEVPSEVSKVHEIPEVSVEDVQETVTNHVYEAGANQFIEMEYGDIFQDDTSQLPELNSDPYLSSAVEINDIVDTPVIGMKVQQCH